MKKESYTEPEFNMAISTLNRINNLMSEYNSYDDILFEQRFEVLKKLYEEVYPFEHDKNKDSIKTYDDLIDDIESELNKFTIKRDNSIRFRTPLICSNDLKKNIFDLSKKIRVALYEHHLLMKKGEEAGHILR